MDSLSPDRRNLYPNRQSFLSNTKRGISNKKDDFSTKHRKLEFVAQIPSYTCENTENESNQVYPSRPIQQMPTPQKQQNTESWPNQSDNIGKNIHNFFNTTYKEKIHPSKPVTQFKLQRFPTQIKSESSPTFAKRIHAIIYNENKELCPEEKRILFNKKFTEGLRKKK
jgi:hypothetical protein